MKILEGPDIDLIEPFPEGFFKHAAEWVFCHKTFVLGDEGPRTPPIIEEFLRAQARLPHVRTWGVVDKYNKTGSRKSEVPLVGIVYFERSSPWNGYFHATASHKAWGEKLVRPGFMQQAGTTIINALWEQEPELQRVSVACFANNAPAKHLATRLGFVRDGCMWNMGRAGGKPVNVVHYGMLRPEIQSATASSETSEVPDGLGKQDNINQ